MTHVQKIPTIETSMCEKRPTQKTYKRDPQKRPIKEACGQQRANALRYNTCAKRDPQKRPPCVKRDLLV